MPTPRKSQSPGRMLTPTRSSRRLRGEQPEVVLVQEDHAPACDLHEDQTTDHDKIDDQTPVQNVIEYKQPARDVIEDRFFKLKEMENFLDEQDQNPNSSSGILTEFDDDVGDADYRYKEFFGDSSKTLISGNREENEKSPEPFEMDESILIEKEIPVSQIHETELQSAYKRVRFSLNAEEQKEIEKDLKAIEPEDENDIANEQEIEDVEMEDVEMVEVFDNEEEADETEDENEDENEKEDENENETEDENENEDMNEQENANPIEHTVAYAEQSNREIDDNEDEDTTFIKQQKNLRATIAQLEQQNLQPRSWELAGEVAAQDREPDTLLSQYLDVDYRAAQAPVITEDVNSRIEFIVKQRIKDKNYDDVIRVKRVDESLQTYRARTNIDEIERKSLMEMYEKQYVDKAKAVQQQVADDDETTEKLDPASETIQKEMTTIFDKLDALSHANYRPTEVVGEPEVIVNSLAVNLEEIGQKAATAPDEELLAPEEIAKHVKAAPKSKEERDLTDKKRERRKKKMKQKVLVRKGIKKEGEYKAEADVEARNPANKLKKKKKKSVASSNGFCLKLDKKMNVDFYAQLQATNEKEQKEKTTKSKRKKAERSSNIKTGAQYKL